MEYYDLLLSAIPLSLISGASIGLLTALPLSMTVGAGAVVASGLIYHGMFRNAPVQVAAHKPL